MLRTRERRCAAERAEFRAARMDDATRTSNYPRLCRRSRNRKLNCLACTYAAAGSRIALWETRHMLFVELHPEAATIVQAACRAFPSLPRITFVCVRDNLLDHFLLASLTKELPHNLRPPEIPELPAAPGENPVQPFPNPTRNAGPARANPKRTHPVPLPLFTVLRDPNARLAPDTMSSTVRNLY